MTIRGLSDIACSHSHFWNPFCPHLPLSNRVANAFFVGLSAAVSYITYSHILGYFTKDQSEKKFLLRTLKIQSEEEIGKLPEIVKVSLDILQMRARPDGDTVRGFIQENESLLKIIQINWRKARQANITHTEIADHLNYLIKAAKETSGKAIPYDVITRTSDPAKGPVVMPRFSVTFIKKEVFDTDIFRSKDAAKEEGASKEEAVIINSAVPGKYIRWTPLRERYIREFGFYSLGMEFDTVLEVLKGRSKV